MELIVGGHAIDQGRERISGLNKFSNQSIERWYKENVLFAEEIPWGSELYFRLERGKEDSSKKFLYYKDDFGIYVVEVIDEQRGFLHTIRDLENFGESSNLKLVESFDDEQLGTLIEFRNALGQTQKDNKVIEEIVA